MPNSKQTDEQIIKSAEKLVNRLEQSLKPVSVIVVKTIKPLDKKLKELQECINDYKTTIETTQRIYRLAIAVFQLFDVTDVDEIWSRGLVSRERYDALSWEFHSIYNRTFYNENKWKSKDQHREAMKEIMDDYREATNPRYKKD